MRGIILQGVSASENSMDERKFVWSKLASEWKPKNLGFLTVDSNLESLSSEIDKILTGSQQGRVVIDMRL